MNRTVKFALAAVAAVTLSTAFADEEAEVEEEGAVGWTPVAVSLASPVQLPWGIAKWDVFGLGFGLFYNDDCLVYGLELCGLANTVREDFRGVALSGVFNYCNKDVYGIRASLGANLDNGVTRGWEIGSIGWHRTMNGLDSELVANVQENLCGAAFSLAGSFTKQESYGFTGGCVNLARTAYGCQLGFLYNQTEELHGCQIALVNYARECPWGFQIGLVNIILDNKIKVLPIVNGYF